MAAQEVLGTEKAQYTAIEIADKCMEISKQIAPNAKISWKKSLPAKNKNNIIGFSYSLLELPALPDWVTDFDRMIIIEPSDRKSGRRMLELRQKIIDLGYYIWAPCTHQGACPLLVNSKNDWCHNRIHWQMPDWFLEIEKKLPIKNKTLTFTYMLVSREKPPEHLKKLARLTGDQQKEKGKTKQMVCRSSEREFMSWLQRNKFTPDWQRGELIEIPQGVIKVANELRLP